ncbi:MAG: hypothetical protein Kow0063_18750 [Anaerolineae bacterium]
MIARPERPATPETTKIIGRDKEEQAIRDAIEGRESCALHFVGGAGMGKTRQLREVNKWDAAQQERRSPVQVSFEWLGLFDLYHSDFHMPGLIEEEIARKIAPGFERHGRPGPFQTYREKREQFEERRRQGVASERERIEVTQAFVSDYNKWATGRRVVIAFDTLEAIIYEQDDVFSIGEGRAGSADVKGWLLQVLPQLQNTVMLLASRPHPQLQADFERSFGQAQVCYQLFTLDRLSQEDALGYVNDILAQRPDIMERFEDPDRPAIDIYHDIWRHTQGVPILMGLVIDLVAFGNLAALDRLRRMGDPDAGKRVRKLLIEELKEIQPPIWDTLRCLAVARKGLTPELFQKLTGWGPDRCHQELDRLRGRVFTKSREGSEALFLHDALYEMFDEFQPFPLVDPGRLLPLIIDYYEEQIRDCEEVLRHRRERLRELELRKDAGIATSRDMAYSWTLKGELAQEERELQRLKVEMLFYWLWRDPREGFELYAREYNEALKAHDFDYDARLHDEVLRYLKSMLYTESEQAKKLLPRSRFDRHCGVRWVKFHLARDDVRRAADVAGRMLEADEPPLGGPKAQDDRLYQAELRLWRAEALLYLGQEQEAERWLKESLGILRRSRASRPYLVWRRSRLTGRAYNDLGYIYWRSQRYGDSVQEYRKAITQFRKADIRDELADTLNSLAYVYALLGDTSRAKALVEDARQLREQAGQTYPLALTCNTTGEIHTLANEPEEGIAWCERARRMFADMEGAEDGEGYSRGLGLAYLGLGRAHRKLGDKGKRGQYSFKAAEGEFEEAARWLEMALAIFGGDEPRVNEPLRHWEALNELGSTYTDWAYLLAWHGLHKQADEKYQRSVEYQERAAQVAEKDRTFELQLLDSYDDLAYAYAQWGQQDVAEDYLKKIYEAVPEEYQLVKGRGFQKLSNPVDGYWLVLGKYHLQRGIWARKAAERGDTPQDKDRHLDVSARHFALAMAYFQKFSPEQTYVYVTSRTVYQHFRDLKPQRLERLRREVRNVAREYRVNLSRLLDTLDDTLGLSV